ncbi:MAG: acetyl-CoA carboxylase biotin carboxyl carrier protein subunit, partial [Candidatus Nanopelagicaceae bacterium]
GGAAGDGLLAPMQGTVVKIAVKDGDLIKKGELLFVLEAMKMEQPLTAHKSGKVSGIVVEIGETVASGTVLCEILD